MVYLRDFSIMSWQFDVEKFRRRFVARGRQLAEISPALSKPSASPREWNDDDYSTNSRYWTKWEARDDNVFPPISDDVVKVPSFASSNARIRIFFLEI